MDIDRGPDVRTFNVFNRRGKGPAVIGTEAAFLVRTLVRNLYDIGRSGSVAPASTKQMDDRELFSRHRFCDSRLTTLSCGSLQVI